MMRLGTFKLLSIAIAAAASLLPATSARAQNPISMAKDMMCPDHNFAKQIARTCWRCFFPFTLFSVPIGGTSSRLPNRRAGPICVCPGRTGYPSVGFTLGWWSPDHVVETTRLPWCLTSLGGLVVTSDKLTPGDYGAAAAGGAAQILPGRWGGTRDKFGGEEPGASYYNFHYIKFPLAYFIGWLSDFACSKKGNTGIDIAFMSEFDPSWNNDALALWTSPETKLFAGPWAPVACAADGVAATVHKPIDALFFCSGTWGLHYPFSGHTPTSQSPPRDASLAAITGVAKMHRFTLAKKSYGNGAVCADQTYFVLPKQQYRMQMMFPTSERNNHWVGASSFRWGEWRTIPATGEDWTQMVWSFHDCCVTLW